MEQKLEVQIVKPELEHIESIRKRSEINKAAVDQPHAEEGAVCIEPGQVSLSELRDSGRGAVC